MTDPMKTGVLVLVSVVLLLAGGCGDRTQTMRFSYHRPALVTLPDGVETMLIAPLAASDAQDKPWTNRAADTISNVLADSSLARQGLDIRLAEPGQVVESAGPAAELARQTGAESCLFGSIDTSHSQRKVVDPYIDPQTGQVSRRDIWAMSAKVTMQLRLIHAADSATITAVEITRTFDSQDPKDSSLVARVTDSLRATDEAPSAEPVLADLIEQCARAFVARISPSRVTVEADLLDGLPEALVATANQMAVRKDYQTAADLYMQAMDEAGDQAGVMYNLGLVYEAMGRLNEAAAMYGSASMASARPIFSEALQRVERAPLIDGS